jgi:hypothetical protein
MSKPSESAGVVCEHGVGRVLMPRRKSRVEQTTIEFKNNFFRICQQAF